MRQSELRLTVRGYELDSFGHVNNSVYLQYAEQAIWNFIKSSGLLDCINRHGLFPVVMESNARYHRELRLMDEVRIESTFHCTAGVMFCEHRIINDANGLTCCKVKEKIVYVTRDRVIHNPPDEVINYLEHNTNED